MEKKKPNDNNNQNNENDHSSTLLLPFADGRRACYLCVPSFRSQTGENDDFSFSALDSLFSHIFAVWTGLQFESNAWKAWKVAFNFDKFFFCFKRFVAIFRKLTFDLKTLNNFKKKNGMTCKRRKWTIKLSIFHPKAIRGHNMI